MAKIKLKELIERERAAGRPHTHEELAVLIGVTPGAIGRWARGQLYRIELPMLDKLCAYFGVGVEDLLEAEVERNGT